MSCDLVGVYLMVTEQYIYYSMSMVLHCQLQRSVLIDCYKVRICALDEQEGDQIWIVHVNGPVQGISAAVSYLVHQVVVFFNDDFSYIFLIVDVVRLLLHDACNLG